MIFFSTPNFFETGSLTHLLTLVIARGGMPVQILTNILVFANITTNFGGLTLTIITLLAMTGESFESSPHCRLTRQHTELPRIFMKFFEICK